MKSQDLENDNFKLFHSLLTMITIQIYIKYIYITKLFFIKQLTIHKCALLDCIKQKCRDSYVLYIPTVHAFGLVLLTHTLLVQTLTHDVSAPWSSLYYNYNTDTFTACVILVIIWQIVLKISSFYDFTFY